MLVTMKKKSERTLRNRLLQAGMVMAAAVILFASMGLPAQAGKKRRAQTAATPLTYGDAYIIKFDGNGATGGVMDDMVLPTGLAYPLETNRYTRTGYSFAGWSDASGNVYNNNQIVQNLKNGRIESRKLAVFSAGFPINQALKFRSTQGSVVFDRNGHRYLAFTASINDPSYYAGDLSHYETAVLLYDLTTGQLVADVHNLNFDHGNSMCYNPDNGHIYIAEGGSLPGYPSGIMELTWDLKAIDSHGFPDLGRAFSITYANGQYFVIGKGPRDGDATTLFRLNSDMQTSASGIRQGIRLKALRRMIILYTVLRRIFPIISGKRARRWSSLPETVCMREPGPWISRRRRKICPSSEMMSILPRMIRRQPHCTSPFCLP